MPVSSPSGGAIVDRFHKGLDSELYDNLARRFFKSTMASYSGTEGDVLSDRFLEQVEIRSEADCDDPEVGSDRENGGSIDWDFLERRFSDDLGFREWVSRKAGSVTHRGGQLDSVDSMSSGKNRSIRSGDASFRYAERGTLTSKPTDRSPMQKRPSHNSTTCSQPLKESCERGRRNRSSCNNILKPPRYDGRLGSVESHLTQFAIVAQRNQWDDGEKADFLMCSLTGEASNVLKDLPANPVV